MNKYFTSTLLLWNYLKGLSFALNKDKDSISNNHKFHVLSSWLLKTAGNKPFCFPSTNLLEKIPMLFEVLLGQDRKYSLIVLRNPCDKNWFL